MINGTWDILELLFVIFFWVETKGKTLEEIDELMEGEKHSNVPDLELIRKGEVDAGETLVGLEVFGQDAKNATVTKTTGAEL